MISLMNQMRPDFVKPRHNPARTEIQFGALHEGNILADTPMTLTELRIAKSAFTGIIFVIL